MKKLYVGNLSYNTTEEGLRAAFEKYASVTSTKVISDKFSGQSRGFGFVELNDDQEADKAIQEMDGTNLDGKALKVNEARPQTGTGGGARSGGWSDKPRSFGGGGGRSNGGGGRSNYSRNY